MRKFPPLLIDAIVVALFIAPVVGIAAAIWTGNPLWLFLLFAWAVFV